MHSAVTEILEFSRTVYESFTRLSVFNRTVVGGLVAVYLLRRHGGSLLWGVYYAVKPLRERRLPKPEYKPGVVYLHSFPRKTSKMVPNLSPFAVKVETWLRLHKVKYEFIGTIRFSKATRQMPYVMYNGVEYVDSDLIIDFLTEEFHVDTSSLTDEQEGMSRAVAAMLDERTCLTYLLYRYDWELPRFQRYLSLTGAPFIIRKLVIRGFPRFARARAEAQTIGRKPKDVIISIGNKDLQALSKCLGEKQFLLGDEITRVDCCAFGHLCQLLYVDLPYPYTQFIQAQCPNLSSYVNRVKDTLWPDWSHIVDTELVQS